MVGKIFNAIMANRKQSEYYQSTGNNILNIISDKGTAGEWLIYRCLKNIPGHKHLLFNCYIPKEGGGTTEIDAVMVHASGIYVFESKNYSGWIFGSDTQKYWTQTLPAGNGMSHKVKFYSPVLQNRGHIRHLKKLLHGLGDLPYYSCIVFSERCTLKSITLAQGRDFVFKRGDIYNVIYGNIIRNGDIIGNSMVDSVYERLLPFVRADRDVKQGHIDNINNNYKN